MLTFFFRYYKNKRGTKRWRTDVMRRYILAMVERTMHNFRGSTYFRTKAATWYRFSIILLHDFFPLQRWKVCWVAVRFVVLNASVNFIDTSIGGNLEGLRSLILFQVPLRLKGNKKKFKLSEKKRWTYREGTCYGVRERPVIFDYVLCEIGMKLSFNVGRTSCLSDGTMNTKLFSTYVAIVSPFPAPFSLSSILFFFFTFFISPDSVCPHEKSFSRTESYENPETYRRTLEFFPFWIACDEQKGLVRYFSNAECITSRKEL